MTNETTAPAQSLHDQIMRLPTDATKFFGDIEELLAYKAGHRDACHAAAELAAGYEADARQAAPVAVPDDLRAKAENFVARMRKGAEGDRAAERELEGEDADEAQACAVQAYIQEAAASMVEQLLAAAPTPPAGPWEFPCTPPAPETDESIAADCYESIADVLNTEPGWSVLEHVEWMKELLGQASEYLHDVPESSVGGSDVAVELCQRMRLCLAGKAPGYLAAIAPPAPTPPGQPAAPVDVPDEREAFEQWVDSYGWPIQRRSDGDTRYYEDPTTQLGWEAWKARALLAAAPTPPEHTKVQKCGCTMREKLVGDGCHVCNPGRAADLQAEQPECGCCGKTGPCDLDCDAVESVPRELLFRITRNGGVDTLLAIDELRDLLGGGA